MSMLFKNYNLIIMKIKTQPSIMLTLDFIDLYKKANKIQFVNINVLLI